MVVVIILIKNPCSTVVWTVTVTLAVQTFQEVRN